jgi:CBS domain-containing protein
MTAFTALGDLPVSALVASDIVRVATDADLVAVATALTDGDVGVVAVGEPDSLLGVVSERDIVHALAAGRDPILTTAADLASTTIVWCDSTATVTEVAAEMMDRYVRHVVVRDDGGIAGIVSARDLLGAFAAAAMSGDDSGDDEH